MVSCTPRASVRTARGVNQIDRGWLGSHQLHKRSQIGSEVETAQFQDSAHFKPTLLLRSTRLLFTEYPRRQVQLLPGYGLAMECLTLFKKPQAPTRSPKCPGRPLWSRSDGRWRDLRAIGTIGTRHRSPAVRRDAAIVDPLRVGRFVRQALLQGKSLLRHCERHPQDNRAAECK